MKAFLAVATLFLAVAFASAESFDYDLDTSLDQDAEARLFFVNFTSSLVQVNATILAYGLLFLAILGAAAVALYYLYLESQNGGSGYGYSYGQQQNYGYQYARSNDAAPEFNMAKIVEWMAIFRDMYENMDVNDIECQKRLICDIVQNESYFGAGATNLKKGFRAARFLEYVSLPDDIRELADEYLDANSRAEKNQDCSQYFQCPFSINESARTNLL